VKGKVKMATEGHRHGRGKDHQQKRKAEVEKELSEIRAEMERLAFKMQQEAKVRWRYEWPLKRTTKWHVRKLLARGQQQVLKRWLRYAENLSDEGKRSGRGLVGFQVRNEKGSVDLVNFQEGRGDIPNFQVGKGEEVSSAESSHQGVLTDEEEAEERPRSGENSCGIVDRVNEDDEKLKTSTVEEKDQGSILVIGGIEVFLPHSLIEARECVADATKRQLAVTVIEEEKEKMLMSAPVEEEEHTVKMLTPWEKELEMLEDWLNDPEPENGLPGDNHADRRRKAFNRIAQKFQPRRLNRR
jgi:hypothetical protein